MKEKNCDCLFDVICNIRAIYDFIKEEFVFCNKKNERRT